MGVNAVADKTSPRTLAMDTTKDLKEQIFEDDSDKKESDNFDFYRYMLSDFHGIARCKVITNSAYQYMKSKGPGVAWKTILLSFDNYFNCEAKRLDGVRCTDARLIPSEDLKVAKPLNWAGQGFSVGGVICESIWGIDGKRQLACPRYIARRLCDQLEEEFKLKVLHASEMEFIMFNEDGKPLFDDGCLYIPQEFSFLEKDLLNLSKYCEDAGIPIETIQTEFAPGQIEVVLKPVFGIEGADNEFLFKNATKEILQKPNQRGRATFMSKPLQNNVGNSNHFNHSLWWVTKDGKVEDAMWDGTAESCLTKTAEHWLAGILKHTPALSAISCPTVNCWRRLHSEGSTRNIETPHFITWGIENRLAMIRVIARGAGKATYFENRLPGAAMNPYLALAGIVAAGMDGIRNEYKLPKQGNELNEYGVLPTSLEAALQALNDDTALKELLGEEFVNWFISAKEKEIEVVKERSEETGDSFKAEFEFYSKWI